MTVVLKYTNRKTYMHTMYIQTVQSGIIFRSGMLFHIQSTKSGMLNSYRMHYSVLFTEFMTQPTGINDNVLFCKV